jgi:hypothetical protein
VLSSEFLDWVTFTAMEKEREYNSPSTDHYYLARIVMAIASIFHKNPSSLKLENFLIKFTKGDGQVETPEASKETALQKSKSVWAAMAARFGFKKKETV